MSGESYAPRSPDLASFFAGSSTSPAKAQGWTPLPPQGQGPPHDALPPSRPHEQPHLHLQPPPYYPPAAQPVSPVSPYSQQPSSHQPLYSPPTHSALLQSPSQNIYGLPGPPLQHQQQYFPPYSDQQYHEQRPTSSPRQLSYPQSALPYSVGAQALPQQHQQPYQQLLHQEQPVPDYALQSPSDAMPPRRSAAAAAAQAIKQEAQQQHQPPPLAAIPAAAAASAASAASAAPVSPSPVRTKFPTARIKRIMQADDEVGKVAQQTPIAVGKALELFMVAMVSKSAEVARDRGSKRVTAQMLKHVVETDEQWDFLRDIVSKVDGEEKEKEKSGSGSGSAKRAKAESESDEEVVGEKKKGRAGRKKKT